MKHWQKPKASQISCQIRRRGSPKWRENATENTLCSAFIGWPTAEAGIYIKIMQKIREKGEAAGAQTCWQCLCGLEASRRTAICKM